MPTSKKQQQLNDIIADLRGKKINEIRHRFEYRSKEIKDNIDWTAYNQAQIEEIDNQLILIKNMVADAAKRIFAQIDPSGREGKPPKNAANKAKAVLIQQYFMASDRLTAGLVWFLREKLGVTEKLTPKDVERAYDNSDVIAILMELFAMTNEPFRDKETKFSIDGSGMPTSIKQNYESDKSDEKKKAVYGMLIGMIGIKTKLFTAFDVAGPGSESPHLPSLLNETHERYGRIDAVYADAGYISRENCSAIFDAGASPYIFPKTGITLSQKGSSAWKHMLLSLIDDPQKWLEEYHQRSISESVNSVWKRKYTRPLAREIKDRRKIEVFARVVCFNIRRLSYLHYLWDEKIPWLVAG